MERDVRYVVVGVVVALLLALFIATVVWQAQRYGRTTGEVYTVIVEGDIGGLKSGSIARYLGVRAGRITELRLSPEDAGRVEVDVRLRPEIPVSSSTEARIKPQGITGESFLSLRTPNPKSGPAPTPPWSEYPVIQAQPSALDTVLADLPGLVERLDRVARRAGRLLGPDNRERVERLLDDAHAVAGRIDGLADGMDRLFARGEQTLEGVDKTLAEIETGAESVSPTLAEIKRAAARVETVIARIEEPLASSGEALDDFATRGLPEVIALTRDLRATARSLNRLSDDLARDPSQVVHRPPDGGVEVPP